MFHAFPAPTVEMMSPVLDNRSWRLAARSSSLIEAKTAACFEEMCPRELSVVAPAFVCAKLAVPSAIYCFRLCCLTVEGTLAVLIAYIGINANGWRNRWLILRLRAIRS